MSNLFTRQKRGVGLAYPLPGADTLLAIDAVNDDIQLDTARMAATAIISTESFDRDGDIVEQAGLDFENYSKNPVVFFNHQAWPLPIGKSEDQDGRLTVQKLDHHTTATCYFSQNSAQAEQIYHLVADKTLRGTSIGFLVKRAVPLQGAETLGMARLTNRGRDAGYRIQAAEVTEWSWVGIGANPDAVLVHLQKGLIAGRAIDERLKMALEPYAARMHGGLVAVPAEAHQIEKGGKYDPKKHPRGGNSKNPGQFSSGFGSHAKPKKKPGKGRPASKKPPRGSGGSKKPAKPGRGTGRTDHRLSAGKPSKGPNKTGTQPSSSQKPTGSASPGTERYVAGLSIQRNTRRPLMAEVSKVESKLGNQMKKDKTIVESRVVGTMGRYGKSQEKSFFTQWTAKKEEHDPAPIISTIAKIGKDNKQWDVFISKVLEDHEDSPNARPGAEVRFRSKLTVNEANRICAVFRKFGIDGFTMTPGPDHKRGSRTFVGMRVQVIPEFSMRFDPDFRERMKIPGEVEKELAEKTRKMIEVIGIVSRMKKVESASLMKFDTLVIGRENYDEFIGGRSSRSDQNGGSHAWFGQSIRDIIEKTVSRLSPKEEKRYFPGFRDRHLHRVFRSGAFSKTKEKKEKVVASRGLDSRIRRTVATNSKWFGSIQSNGLFSGRFLSSSFSLFRAPMMRFLKAIPSRSIRSAQSKISPAWAFLKNLSRVEVAPLISVGGRPRSHRHYCIKCKKCQRRIFACRCPSQNKPVKWSTCDPCLGSRMVVKSMGAARPVINLASLIGQPKSDHGLHLALKRIHQHHANYDLTRSQALTLSIAAHAIQEEVAGRQGARWHRLSPAKKLKMIERVVNSQPEASSKQAYVRVFNTLINQ